MGWTWELQLISWVVVLYVGAAIGSFLNVVVYRLPRGLSLIRPGSRCPSCKTPLGPSENVPVLGWLWLRGRCRHCGARISWRYPAVETATMLLFALSFAVFHFRPEALATAILLSWLLALALIDLDTFLLPEELTRSGLVVGAVAQILLPWMGGNGSVMASLEAFILGVLGAVCGIWSLELIGWAARLILKREAMGFGDGKLLAMIGMWLGWQGVVLTIFLSSIVGTLGSGMGLLLRRVQWGKAVPFGPYLAIGGGIAALFGSEILSWYQSWWGLG